MTLSRIVLEVPPSGLTAAAVSSSQINLAWQVNPRATSYIVRRNGVTIATQAGTTLNVTGLTPSTSYTFTVASVGATGEGPQSSGVTTSTQASNQDTTPPTTPGTPSLTVLGSTSIFLSWAGSVDNVSVLSYELSRRVSGGSFSVIATLTGTPPATSYTDTGLSGATVYEYRVRAQDAAGNFSAFSGIASATTTGGGFPGMQTGRLWAGLSGPADPNRDLLSMNVMKYARSWTGQIPGQPFGAGTAAVNAVLDSNGYPTVMPAGVNQIETFLLTNMPAEMASFVNGRYRFLYDGAGTIQFAAIGPGSSVSNIVTSAGQIEFDYVSAPFTGSDVYLVMRIFGITQGNHPRNFRLFKTEYASRIAAGFITRPNYDWGNTRVMRFLNTFGDVATLRSPQAFSWTQGGASINEIVQIANELGISPWINLYHEMTDTTVNAIATYVRDNLNPALKIYVEWSNEVWNRGAFPVGGYCGQQALAEFGTDVGTDWLQWGAGRASQCMNIFSSVFAGQTTRLVRILGGFQSIPDWTIDQLDAPKWVALGRPRPGLSFDAVAVGGYFFAWEGETDPGSPGQVDQQTLLDLINTSGTAAATQWIVNRVEGPAAEYTNLATLYNEWTQFKSICTARGLQLFMYEGGTHIKGTGSFEGNATLTNFLTSFSYTAEMGDLYRQALTFWDTVGDGAFNAFVGISGPSRFGSWGAMRYPGDLNPRALLLQEYNSAPLAGGKRRDVWSYLNSLRRHDSGAGNASTSVGNWIARMAPGAPNGGNIYTGGRQFGFADGWDFPPSSQQGEEEVTSLMNGTGWTNANQIELVEFVPDNFEGPRFDPSVVTGMGFAYTPRLLQFIDAWEANAPNPNRVYAVYAGWPDMSSYGEPASLTTTARTNYRTYALGAYQAWMELLVTQLRAARPSLNIRLHNINKATITCWRDTVVNNIPTGTLFEDDAPHGFSSWYFLAGVAEYIEIYNEKPPRNFVFNPAWGVSSTITSNYQAIVDNIYQTLRP